MTNEPSVEQPTPRGLGAFVESMRVAHWVKNSFVAVPLLFSGAFLRAEPWLASAMAVAAFCLLASGVYMLNDVCDAGKDRLHPTKRNRPVASGRLSPVAAVMGGVGLILLAFALTFALTQMFLQDMPLRGLDVLAWTAAYLALNLLYSFRLKRVPILDVLLVAMGFVLRAMAGAAAIGVPISPWLVVCTLSLTLFIALTKRRSEIVELDAGHAESVRDVNRQYTPAMVEHMLTVASGMAIVTYMLYCLAKSTVERFGSAHMVWTIPLVVYGVFRYNMLTRQAGKNDPVKVLLGDVGMWVVVLAYIAATAVIYKFGRLDGVADVLEILH